jgi:hypothetical protein
VALLAAVLAGAALRIWQFSIGRSLWLDEAALALNVLTRSGARLMQVLDYGQMAPSGFLMLQKSLTLTFGSSEWVFRLWPLAASVLALAAVALVARRLLPPVGGLVATSLFAFNHRLVYYASEAKQYSGDVAAGAVLLWVGCRACRKPFTLRAALALGVVGAAAGWVSHPAVFVLAGLGAGLLVIYWQAGDRRSVRWLFATFVIWGLCLAPELLASLHSVGGAAQREYMMRSWSGGFPPALPVRARTVAWFVTAPSALFQYLFDARPWTALLLVALCAAGAAAVWWTRRPERMLLLLPLCAGFAAGVFRLLPLAERVGLWVTPFVALLLGAGIGLLGAGPSTPRRLVGAAAGAALVAFAAARSAALLPEYREELRPVLAALAPRFRPGEGLYVYYGAVPAVRYYAPRFAGLDAARREGTCARNQWRRYVGEIAPVQGPSSAWFVVSHVQKPEVDFILGALDRLGRRTDAIEADGAGAYRFAFEGPAPQRVDEILASIPPDRDRGAPDWVCLGGPLSASNWPGGAAGGAR